MTIAVREATTKRDIKTFIRVPYFVYRNDPNYRIPLELERLDALNPKKNPYFEHAEVALFIAERDGKAIGRISAQIDTLAQDKWGPNLGHFGFFDAEDQETADALLDTAENWARARGMVRLQGPWSLSANMECGLLVDGFDTPPMVFMPHDKPETAKWLEARGYKGCQDMYAYNLDISDSVPEKPMRFVNMAIKNKRLSIRHLDMKNYDRDINQILEIFNDAWAENWGYVPFTDAEGKHMASELKLIIKSYRTVITEVDGELAGFLLVIPDLNHLTRDLGGKLFPFNIFKLIKRMLADNSPRVRTPLMGVKKKFQGGRIGGQLAIWMIEHTRALCAEHGAWDAELSWILESNTSMNGILKEIGCQKYKTMRMFERSIALEAKA